VNRSNLRAGDLTEESTSCKATPEGHKRCGATLPRGRRCQVEIVDRHDEAIASSAHPQVADEVAEALGTSRPTYIRATRGREGHAIDIAAERLLGLEPATVAEAS